MPSCLDLIDRAEMQTVFLCEETYISTATLFFFFFPPDSRHRQASGYVCEARPPTSDSPIRALEADQFEAVVRV
jgi:hypothetical protein